MTGVQTCALPIFAYLGEAIDEPKRPLLAIMGGAKVGDKIALIENLLKKVDTLIIDGRNVLYVFKSKRL